MKFLLVALLLVISQLLVPSPAPAAGDARIDEVVVTNSSRNVLLYFQVRDAITPEMEEGVRNGLPLTITFLVELHRHRAGWPDQRLVNLEFNHRLSYDNLKNEYRVLREELGERTTVTESLVEARQLLNRVSGLAVVPLAELTPDQVYTLRIKARMGERSSPAFFNWLLPFRRLWSFETEWYSVEFRY